MSKRIRGRPLAAIFLAGAASAVLVTPAAAQTLADAIAMAYQSNPTLQAQRATQKALDETYVQSRAGWRPTLNVTSAAVYNTSSTPSAARGSPVDRNGDGIPDLVSGTIENNNSRATLSFNQPLWTGGRTAAAVSAAQADVFAGQENLRRIETQILSTVVQAYSDVRRDQETLRIRQENVSVLTRQRQEAQARFDVGEITRTDVAQAEARLAAAQAALQSAAAQLEVSRANYTAVVGQTPGALAPEPSLAYLLPQDISQALDLGERFNPTLRAQQFTEQASRARVAGAKAERMPTLSAQATLGFNGPAIPEPPFDVLQRDLYTRAVAGTLNFNVPLFAGGSTMSRVRQAVDRNSADRLNIEAARRSVQQTITQQWNQMTAARANIVSGTEQVRAAEIAAEGVRQEQQVGLRTTIDVLNAEQELRSAQLAQVVSRRDEYVAASQVLAALGRLEARNLTPAVPLYDAGAHFRDLKITWGWVPWEEAVGAIDRIATPAPAEEPVARPVEPTLGPGIAQAAPAPR